MKPKRDFFELATKSDLRSEIAKVKQELEYTMIEMKDIILSAMDPLIKDMETRREDRELAAYQTTEIREQLRNHEQRIEKLEQLKS